MRRRARVSWSGDEGQSLVEFALVVPLLLVLIVGLIDSARAVWMSTTLTAAVREGTRYAIVHGAMSSSPTGPGSSGYTSPDQDTAIDVVVRGHAEGVAPMTVSSTWPDGDAKRGSRVTVTATSPFTPALSEALLGGALRVTLRASSTLVIHQ